MIVFLCGFYKIEYEYDSNIDYKEYLGPDWKAEWTGAATHVGNHICFLDIMVMTWRLYPSFIARSTVKETLVLNKIGEAMHLLYV